MTPLPANPLLRLPLPEAALELIVDRCPWGNGFDLFLVAGFGAETPVAFVSGYPSQGTPTLLPGDAGCLQLRVGSVMIGALDAAHAAALAELFGLAPAVESETA